MGILGWFLGKGKRQAERDDWAQDVCEEANAKGVTDNWIHATIKFLTNDDPYRRATAASELEELGLNLACNYIIVGLEEKRKIIVTTVQMLMPSGKTVKEFVSTWHHRPGVRPVVGRGEACNVLSTSIRYLMQ